MKIAVVGLGLIGGSILKALATHTDHYLMGIDTDTETLRQATHQGLLKECDSSGTHILPQADVVFLCIYPQDIPDYLAQHADLFKEGAVISDVASFKGKVVQETEKILPPHIDFVFAHPMRGSEIPGFAASKADLFNGANVIIVPREHNNPSSIKIIEDLYRDLGATSLSHMDAKDHDYKTAYVSHLAHAIAVAYTNSTDLAIEEIKEVAGSSYRDLTRVANINTDLWTDIFFNNKDDLLKTIDEFEEQLNSIKVALEKDKPEQLKSIFNTSKNRQRHLQ